MSDDLDDEWPPSPRNNPDLIGLEDGERQLLDAFNSGRMPHAWIISGPRGIGKATLAYRFARFVLSQGEGGGGLFGDQPDNLYVSPDNPIFRRTAARGHGDLMSVERSLNDKGKLRSEIAVDDVRKIGPFLHLSSAEGGWRVVIIDCADELNRSSANGLLKVFEEPPSQALLLLVSHNPGRLLPTIRSRCRILNLKPLETGTVADLALKYLPGLSLSDASELARLSEGSIGRALSLGAEGGLELYHDLLGLLETLPALDIPALDDLGARLGKAGAEDSFKAVSDLLRWWLGRLIRVVARGDAGAGVSEMEGALLDRLAKTASLDRWLEVWEKINRLLSRADAVNLDRKQVFLNVFLTLESAARS